MQPQPPSKKKTVNVRRGLYLLRYDSAGDDNRPPQVRVGPKRGSERSILLISHPDAQEAVLNRPGSSLVVRAASDGELELEVRASVANGSTVASVDLEPLRYEPLSASTKIDTSQLQIMGHVARRGDVEVPGGTWIAGPSSPSPIEGFELRWPNQPAGISLQYAVQVGGTRPAMSKWVDPGVFVGTRGQGAPLLGANFLLAGPGTENLELSVEALFLGAPPIHTKGVRLNVAGPTGREPLVGLRLELLQRQTTEVVEAPQAAVAAPGLKEPARRVRVFRAQADTPVRRGS